VYWMTSSEVAPRLFESEFDSVHSPTLNGLYVYSPIYLFNLLMPHALTLMLHSYGEGGEEEEGVAFGDAAAGEAMLIFVCKRLSANTLPYRLYVEALPSDVDPEESTVPKHPVVSDPNKSWNPTVNIRVMLQMVIDKMVSCPNAPRRSALRLVLEKVK
jgi:hypothetical protein